MKHFIETVISAEEVDRFIGQPALMQAAGEARSILVQLFAGLDEPEPIEEVSRAIQQLLPTAVVVGVTSGGEIAEGRVVSNTILISLLCFETAVLHPQLIDCRSGDERECGRKLGDSFSDIPQLKGVLLLASPLVHDCAELLHGIEDALPEVILFGGGAGADSVEKGAMVLAGDDISRSKVVAVGLQGENLHIETDVFLGWEALGPHMTLTDVRDNRIITIDDKPAFNVYSHYLCIEPGEDIFLLEFPLLFRRGDVTIARNPVTSDEGGAVTMVADVRKGECARLGYLDIDTVMENTRGTLAALRAFRPQAVLLYSCICRRFFLQQDTELETLPFQQLAPTAGFFTYGEFVRYGDKVQPLNSSQVVVAMREGAGEVQGRDIQPRYADEDAFRMRHIRLTSRLFQFITALTEEVEAANQLLQHKADHDALTETYNRHRLDEDLKNELSRARRHAHPVSLVMLDIDRFKRINDEFGHNTGDCVLKTLVSTVWDMLRRHDTIYRYGGEEFLLLLPEIDLAGAVAVAEKARVAIEQLSIQCAEQTLPQITVSFGVATAPEHGNRPDVLLGAVDEALYLAKRNGRNRVEQAESKK